MYTNSITVDQVSALNREGVLHAARWSGAREITSAAQKMNQLTHQMSEAVTEQKRGGDMIVKAIESIAMVSRQNLVAIEQMSGAARNLATESDSLRQQVETFRT